MNALCNGFTTGGCAAATANTAVLLLLAGVRAEVKAVGDRFQICPLTGLWDCFVDLWPLRNNIGAFFKGLRP
jgi:hypothetical protein